MHKYLSLLTANIHEGTSKNCPRSPLIPKSIGTPPRRGFPIFGFRGRSGIFRGAHEFSPRIYPGGRNVSPPHQPVSKDFHGNVMLAKNPLKRVGRNGVGTYVTLMNQGAILIHNQPTKLLDTPV